jgi:esterase/lipase
VALPRGHVREMTPLITKKAAYQKKSVRSKDGTTIGFRQLGQGPGVVILHGGALASQHYMKLGTALAEEFTVYIPDRRGRGMSGPYGPHYSIEREDEDIDAIVTDTGAQYVFGEADGGLFVGGSFSKTSCVRSQAWPSVFAGAAVERSSSAAPLGI